ncbi:MAG: hypothetical protein ACSLFQ_15255 [Thermoanaerobaculia bacterium]
MTIRKFTLVAIAMLVVASSAMASNFRAADIVYLPSAGKVASGSVVFATDVYITNLTTSKVVVSVGFGETGDVADNSLLGKNLKTLATSLEAGERRLVSDITGTLFPEKDGKLGFLVFFACREGGNCDNCDDFPGDCSLISVEGRIYSFPAGNPAGGTKGQLFFGYPWYSFVSPNDSSRSLDKVFIVGLRNEGARPTSGYRTNFGILNASQDYTGQVKVSVFTGTGMPVGEKTYTLKPLGHVQGNILDAAPDFTTNNSAGYAIIQMVGSTPVPGGCAECAPGFFVFGSVLDNVTDDPTTLESVYTQQLPLTCVYGSKGDRRPVRR